MSFEGTGLAKEVAQLGMKEKTMKTLESANIHGVEPVDRPPSTLPNISDIPDGELVRVYGMFESYAGWIGYCRSRRVTDSIVAEKILRNHKYRKTKEYQAAGTKVKDIDMNVNLDLEFYEQEFMQIQIDLEILKAILEDVEKKAKVISREISMRTSRLSFRQGTME